MLYTPAGYTQEFSKTLNQINKNRIKAWVLIPTFTNKPETFFTVSETFCIFELCKSTKQQNSNYDHNHAYKLFFC